MTYRNKAKARYKKNANSVSKNDDIELSYTKGFWTYDIYLKKKVWIPTHYSISTNYSVMPLDLTNPQHRTLLKKFKKLKRITNLSNWNYEF